MPIPLSTLRSAALRESKSRWRDVTEARQSRAKTVFLCHSHSDASLASGLVTLLAEAGWTAYVDWKDHQMPPSPNRQTAERIQQRIVDSDLFLFLATSNSLASRWCPWEIGFANGRKPIERIIVCPTQEGATTHGSEYLDLYRRLDLSSADALAVWEPGETKAGVLVANL